MISLRPVVELIRLEENALFGTFGVLRIDKQVFCVTLEPCDFENQRWVSSIPAQQYMCARVNSQRYGDTFEVTNVPARRKILFHAGNRESDTSGCIILAGHYGKLGENRAVLNSGKTFKAFLQLMQNHSGFHLTVFERY